MKRGTILLGCLACLNAFDLGAALCSTWFQVYHRLFEPRFLEETRQLYSEEGEVKKNELEVPDYLIHSERRIAEETDRCATCMDQSTL